jgi:hypothetical protein
MYAPFPVLLPLSKCILEVVFYEGVRHCLKFCLDRLICVKKVASSIGETEKSRKGHSQASKVGGEMATIFLLVKKISGEKGSVRRCVVVMQQPVLLLPKFGAKSLRIVMQSP